MQGYTVYAASSTECGGIYKYLLDGSGRLSEVRSLRLDRPMYFIHKDGTLHVLLRAPQEFLGNSGYLTISSDLSRVGEIYSTEGVVSCHLAVTDEGVYTANYLSGSITRIGKRVVTHDKTEYNHPGRQDMPHVHFVTETPEKSYLAVCDLGLDKVFIYDKELNYVSDVSLPHGSGVRHLVFDKSGGYAYTANELDSSTSILRYKDGILRLVGTVEAQILSPNNTAAAIRLSPCGERLFVSQRGADAVSIYRVMGDNLTLERTVSTHGRSPRDIALSPDGKFLLAANEGGSLTVLDVERDYTLVSEIKLPSALCVSVI